MSELRELSYKEISYIRSALEGYIGLLKLDIESEDTDDDERMDLQEDLLFYEKLLYTFQKSEKQSVDLKQIQSIAIKKR
ncbi:hypothetical protein [Microbulbifer sp. VAAF005]|uniref:hypothetical protein n=1 Tax=Microbulbifer sp. VAAF005 TaxID=3034230 RepID=UPI0024AE08AC|nr:hypothetical protein [Microbulbifer sp. VAAF005]WHI48428.1 hypothetical protein P0078_08665 [Microbulbifer sp. VAAF005]